MLSAEKYQGIARITWERYPNGEYVAQVIDDAEGFELYNNCPAIIPPDIEIEPGTYARLCGKYRGTVLTFTETEFNEYLIDQDGFIHWERKARYQMVGKRLRLIEPMKRQRDRVPHGYAFTPWEAEKNIILRIKYSATEFEIKTDGTQRKYLRVPLVLGMKGFAYKSGERVQGRIIPRKLSKKEIQ